MNLHCFPPPNVLHHDIGATGVHSPNVVIAVLSAALRALADVQPVSDSLRRDAKKAKCPKECRKKSIGQPSFSFGSFQLGFDRKANVWHCTVGLAGQIEVRCDSNEVQP